ECAWQTLATMPHYTSVAHTRQVFFKSFKYQGLPDITMDSRRAHSHIINSLV
ncbi:uncharacterized protein METZ01_LOCUS338439, partial [marine metagenome]